MTASTPGVHPDDLTELADGERFVHHLRSKYRFAPEIG